MTAAGSAGPANQASATTYDTFAADLDALLSTLNFSDVRWSDTPWGAARITRYIGSYGTKRLRKAVLIGTLGPYLVKAADNPEGVDPKVFDETRAGIKADRPVAMMGVPTMT